jgi:hypothetical protein
VKEPDQYLGAQIKKHVLPGDDPSKFKWAISSDLYVKKAIEDVQTELALVGKALTTRAKTPLIAGYRPESDVTGLLPERQATYYQGLIGVFR